MQYPRICTFRLNMPSSFECRDVILIDTHNFTTTAAYCLEEGATGVRPITDRSNCPDHINYIGDDWSDGFSNHPRAAQTTDIEGEDVALSTGNGSPAVHTIRSRGSFENLYLASLVNGRSVQNVVDICSEDTLIVLAGSRGTTSPEDLLTAQYLVSLDICENYDLLVDLFEFLYDVSVLQVYNSLTGEDSSCPYGDPTSHAQSYARLIDDIDIVPIYRNGNFAPVE